VVIGSRSDPPLPLARLRANSRMHEIRAAVLRFTFEETNQFLNDLMRLDLKAESVKELEERTEGWITGLQLAALSLGGSPSGRDALLQSFTGSHRYLVDYLLEEVFNRQPAEIQTFLMKTALLEAMQAELCDALGAASLGSQTILERLERANLFVFPLDNQGVWYRYHHLFRDFLLTRLKKLDPQSIPAYHKAACAWFTANNSLNEAARHAFQSQDWDFAADFVEQNSFTLIIHGEIASLHAWCAAFPEEVMRVRPALCILQCWPWVFRFRRENRERVENRLNQAGQAIAAMEDPQAAEELSDHAAVVRSFLAMAPDRSVVPAEQLALAEKSLDNYSGADAGRFSSLLSVGYAQLAACEAQAAAGALNQARQVALDGGLFAGIVESTFQLVLLEHNRGHLRQAETLCRETQAYLESALPIETGQTLPLLGCLDIALGYTLLEQGPPGDVDIHLLKGLEKVGLGLHPYILLTAYMALFRLREIQGRSTEALGYLSKLEATWPDISFCTQAVRLAHRLRTAPNSSEGLNEAADWLKTTPPLPGEHDSIPGLGPLGAAEVYFRADLALVRIRIATGQTGGIGSYLDRQLHLAEAQGVLTRWIELLLLKAEASAAEGETGPAQTYLDRALEIAEPAGYLSIFDQGPVLAGLLEEAARNGKQAGYLRSILSAITSRDYGDSGEGGPSLHIPGQATVQTSRGIRLGNGEILSEREIEVLRLIAQGATNQAIAASLVITVGTVKSHINHILGKLDARNRTEAVARARSHKVLDL
jgi:LuxR family maltose regulon positive regulatory protein